MPRPSDDALTPTRQTWSAEDGTAACPSRPGSPSKAPRLLERNAAIRSAQYLFADGTPYQAAKELQRALRDYLARCWPRERHAEALPVGAGERRAALHRIARLNGGRDLCWRRIYDILSNAEWRARQ